MIDQLVKSFYLVAGMITGVVFVLLLSLFILANQHLGYLYFNTLKIFGRDAVFSMPMWSLIFIIFFIGCALGSFFTYFFTYHYQTEIVSETDKNKKLEQQLNKLKTDISTIVTPKPAEKK
jgi:uncharacterized membrane protein YciS (DUF1049 family)